MNRYEDLVSVAVDSNHIVEVLVLVVWSELHVDLLSYAGRDHALLRVFYLEVRC